MSALSFTSDSTGSRPGRMSLSCTTTQGTRARLQIWTKSGTFDLPPHSITEICSRSASWPSAWKTRDGDLLGHPLDQDRRPREEQLGALGVELAHDAKCVLDVDPLEPIDRRHAEPVASDEIDLLQRSDAEKAWSMRGEEDLVAGLCEPPDQPAEIPMRLRSEEQLWLLDCEHDA